MVDTIKRILAATDFSEGSAEALEYAVYLSKTFGAELHLLHVLEPPFPTLDAALLSTVRKMAERDAEKLKTLSEKVARACPAVQSSWREGSPASEILKAAEDLSADLIVLGTHGRTGIAHAFLGSVAERVMRTAPCAVWTVRSRHLRGGTTQGAAIPIAPFLSFSG
jgi:nucleotide-binding universal stress UspA family protein